MAVVNPLNADPEKADKLLDETWKLTEKIKEIDLDSTLAADATDEVTDGEVAPILDTVATQLSRYAKLCKEAVELERSFQPLPSI